MNYSEVLTFQRSLKATFLKGYYLNDVIGWGMECHFVISL